MRKSAILGWVLTAIALLAATSAAQSIGDGSDRAVTPGRHPPRTIDPVPPIPYIPAPPDSGTVVAFTSEAMQLVGFTTNRYAGDAGVLNLSIACQREFPESRLCTVEEISKSIAIPTALGTGFAWTQNLSDPQRTFELNCNGWMSASPDHQGTAIELGACYGGLVMRDCDTRLAAACCARSGSLTVR